MTIISHHNRSLFPGMGFAMRMGAAPGLSTRVTLTAIGHYCANKFRAEIDMPSLGYIGLRTGAISGTGVTFETRVEQVNAGANWDQPSGTLWATNTLIAARALTTATWNTPAALTAAAAINRGDEFWVKHLVTAGTSISAVFQRFSGPVGNGSNDPFGYDLIASGAIVTNAMVPWFMGSSATVPYLVNGAFPISTIANTGWQIGAGLAKAMKCSAMPMSGRAIGMVFGSLGTATGDFTATLWNGTGSTVRASKACEGNRFAKSTAGPAVVWFDDYYDFSLNEALMWGAESTEAVNTQFSEITLPAAGMRAGWPHNDICCESTRATSGGAWTDDTTKICDYDLIYIPHDGAAAGGGGGGSVFGAQGGVLL